MKKEYTEEGCMLIVERAVKDALQKTTNREIIKRRLNFAETSQILMAWCIATEHDYSFIKNMIITRNHVNLKNL